MVSKGQRVSSSSVVEHPTRSRRVVGSNPIWGSDFFRVYVSPRIYVISCCCYFSVNFKVILIIKRGNLETMVQLDLSASAFFWNVTLSRSYS